jgi:hypothetical protein
LAWPIASSSVSKGVTVTTGPKTSSRQTRAVAGTAGADGAAVGLDAVQVRTNLLVVLLRGQRAELGGRVLRVPYDQGLGGGGEAVEELGVDAALDVQAGAGQADLAGVAEDGLDRPVDRVVQGGVVEDDVGALPPSSRLTGTRLAAAARAMTRPVADSPVKVIRSTAGCSVSAASAEFGP